MPKSQFDDTHAVARLPNLDIEIHHRRPWQGDAEMLSVTIRAVPSFEAFARFLEASNPMLFWSRMAQLAWSAWLPASDRKQITDGR